MPDADTNVPVENETYLKDKHVHLILNDLVCEMMNKKPEDPLNFMVEVLQKMKGGKSKKQVMSDERYPKELNERPLSIVVFGASGDLAKKKTFPALLELFGKGLLPKNVNIVGYARSEMSDNQLRERIGKFLSKNWQEGVIEDFCSRISYHQGGYDKEEDFSKLNEKLKKAEGGKVGNRLFYLALPPAVFLSVTTCINATCTVEKPGWYRVIIEKPFGHDTESSAKLANDLQSVISEEHIYRIDHYLGKEMVQNLIALRFSNKMFSHVWDKTCIDNVQISFKEPFGTYGRGGYFNESGIIRDVMQNHLMQVLALVAMEKPKSLKPEHIRDEKVAVLQCMPPIEVSNTVLGQYTASSDGKEPGYLDDETVPKGSKTPTFAQAVLYINNDRWEGVPFIMKAGKALEKKEVTIRLQFKPELRPFGDVADRNELVVRLQPDEAMYLKVNSKDPGMSSDIHTTELDLTYKNRYDVALPDAYESLIYEAILGSATNFVRSDELDAAWRIFTPLLHKIDRGEVTPDTYEFGTRGPKAADEMKNSHYTKTERYQWKGN